MSTFFCTACISFYLYQQLSSPEPNRFLMYIFGAISYGIPLIITLPLTFTNSIIQDTETAWCETDRVFELTLWFGPLLVCLLTCVFYYIRLRRLFRKKFEYRLNVNDRLRQIDGIISRRLTLYILVFIVTWAPDVVQHFISFFSSCSFYPLMVIQNLLAPSQGNSSLLKQINKRPNWPR
ncbi:cAMP receptor-like protein [Cavenderia fasciculata]|uniref:cAMP receptor-like protein n=1 Tax=Cavenderia fasciculata TaxID=261658 RepID=F4QE44_CACFS|nr:cAMP receptor-like protein [Cavenderia fasciculata]EGG13991.1 cAMP receptor-like protein [Cavenderia fasciculata]|eukprot:XP_004350699.1 cAMP receptor-like protein [Cavenderia fasciculata]